MEAMLTLIVLAGIVGVLWFLGQVRTAAEDVIGDALTKGVLAARGPQPTTWWIVPERLAAAELTRALREDAAQNASFGATTFSVSHEAGSQAVSCSTPPGMNQATVQKAVLKAARVHDQGCHVRL